MKPIAEQKASKKWCPERKDKAFKDQYCITSRCMAWTIFSSGYIKNNETEDIEPLEGAGYCLKYQACKQIKTQAGAAMFDSWSSSQAVKSIERIYSMADLDVVI